MPKEMRFNDEARKAIREGVRKLALAVKTTLGPTGKNVVIKKGTGSPVITKDGVTVAREVSLTDPFENLGAELLREVASKTCDVAGDGTTTATVLAESILEEGVKMLAAGANPSELKRGIDLAVQTVNKHLDTISMPVSTREQIVQVGTISANNDSSIGNLLADVVQKVGKDGVITVEPASGVETYVESVEGLQFEKGYIASGFINNPDTGEAVWENPMILLYDGKISGVREIVVGNNSGLLERAAAANVPFLIIAEDVDGDALTTMVMNRIQGGLKILAVRAPGFGDSRKEYLEDIASVTGTKVFSKQSGNNLNTIQLQDLGGAVKVVVNRDKTLIVGGKGTKAAIGERVKNLQKRLETTPYEMEKTSLRERIGKLTGGVAVVKVGAASEVEMREKKDRVEDALFATRAAVQSGIVPGGGVALVRCIPAVTKLISTLTGDMASGAQIVLRTLSAPLRQIVDNAGQQAGSGVLAKVLELTGSQGYNARTGAYEDLVAAGVVDPTKVTRSALQNAASVAGLMLTTDVLLVEMPEPAKK